MYKIGVWVGKVSPPHRGHLNAIIQAGTQCEKLYVVVSHNEKLEQEMYANTDIKCISLKQKARWLSIELSDLEHIKVLMLDEGEIPVYPYGWEQWSYKLKNLIPEHIDVIFGGEPEYKDIGYSKYFLYTDYVIYDKDRIKYPISATEIRKNPYKNWDYILGSARPFFAKKVLIAGTESCGKSSLVKMLAKIYNTSWAQEEGRYYSQRYMGTNEDVFELDDFYNICFEQIQSEKHALKTANKIVFFDTDAIITQYYCKQYLGEYNPKIENLIDPSRYDLLLMMKPDVKWIADGFRWLSDDDIRWKLHEEIKQMYTDRGFTNIIEIGGNYNERLNEAIEISNKLLNAKE